jgi:heparosan-N-sulfate-glucuronate 5-epimerase
LKRQKRLYPKYFLSHDKIFPDGVFNVPVDENGVATWDYKGHLGLHKEYNPTMIALYALSLYNLYHDTLKEIYMDKFFTNVDFLVKNFADRGIYGVWLYDFPWIAPGCFCKPPWGSSLAQGLGISVMVRAWMLAKDNEYLHTAKKALASFEVPVPSGGVLTIDKGGFWWYDEYACTKSANVLNGFLCALIGICELHDVTKDDKAKFLLNKGIETAKKFMKKFDLNLFAFKWSKYDDKLLLYSGPKYHSWHVKQLIKLYEITEDKEFLKWAVKWSRYQEKYSSIINAKWFRLLWRSYVQTIRKLAQHVY